MKIQNLALHNFGSFNKIEIRLEPSVSVVPAQIAPTVFAAIARILGVYLRSFYIADLKAPALKAEDGNAFPIVLNMSLTDPDMKVNIAFRQKSRRALTSGAKDLIQKAQDETLLIMNHQPLILPVILSYQPCSQWFLAQDYDHFKSLSGTRLVGYVDAISSLTNFKGLLEWMMCVTMAKKQYDLSSHEENWVRLQKQKESDYIFLQMQAVSAAVYSITEGVWRGFHFDLPSRELCVYDAAGTLTPLSALTHDQRVPILLAADIAHRSVKLNEELGFTAPQESTGIVIIPDNIVSLESLHKTFPKMQFLISEVSDAKDN